jgi:hypothetical protein
MMKRETVEAWPTDGILGLHRQPILDLFNHLEVTKQFAEGYKQRAELAEGRCEVLMMKKTLILRILGEL